mmetsp:Transcript_3183/g.8311  ORF Transcript_3183/g.8311 Transcript_3183/m.8311 type:complete len:355 (-) Transcript_3183:18-1082(-)
MQAGVFAARLHGYLGHLPVAAQPVDLEGSDVYLLPVLVLLPAAEREAHAHRAVVRLGAGRVRVHGLRDRVAAALHDEDGALVCPPVQARLRHGLGKALRDVGEVRAECLRHALLYPRVELRAQRRLQQPLQRCIEVSRADDHDARTARAVGELQHDLAKDRLDILQDRLSQARGVAPRVCRRWRPQVREALLHKHVVRELLVPGHHGALDGIVVHAVAIVEPLLHRAAMVRELGAAPVPQLQHPDPFLLLRQARVILDVADAPESHPDKILLLLLLVTGACANPADIALLQGRILTHPRAARAAWAVQSAECQLGAEDVQAYGCGWILARAARTCSRQLRAHRMPPAVATPLPT